MAITFTDHSINGNILNAFNNNVVRFSSDISKTIVDAYIVLRSKNLFNYKTVTDGYYVNWVSGGLGLNASYYASDFIPVNPNTNYFCNSGSHYAWYDSNKNIISGESGITWPLTSPANAAYIRISFSNSANRELIQFETGNASTEYEKYLRSEFNITPSPVRNFYFNFKTAVKKLINDAKFADSCDYQVGQLFADIEAYLSVIVDYKITFDDATNETATFTYQFIKGVNQLTEKAFFNERGIAFPLHKPVNKIAYLTYFRGFPFDIALFGEDIEISVDSFLSEAQFLAVDLPAMEVNPQTVVFQNDNGVNRLVISDGLNQWNQIIDKYHNIRYGDYEIRMRVEDKCGLYFKWHNEYGGWDYWLFEKNYLIDMSDKQKGEIQMDFDNLPDAKSIVASTGKVVEDSLTLFANGVYDYEIQRVLGIARSPKVYMYTGEKDAQNDDDYWIEVQISSANPQYKQSTFRKTISIKVDIPSNYTLEL